MQIESFRLNKPRMCCIHIPGEEPVWFIGFGDMEGLCQTLDILLGKIVPRDE